MNIQIQETRYNQGCVDGSMRAIDIILEDLAKQDCGRSKTLHRTSINRIKRLKVNLDLDAARNGHRVFPHTQKGVRGEWLTLAGEALAFGGFIFVMVALLAMVGG